MTVKKWQIVLGGTGGQGLIVGGVSLAKAAILEGKKAVETQIYGIQSRGGYSQAEVVISTEDIFFPKCSNPDLVLALCQTAYDRYKSKVSDECVILYDQNVVNSKGRNLDIGYPFNSKAIALGNERVINSLALGAVLKICPVVAKETLLTVLEHELPVNVLPLNLKAFEVAYTDMNVYLEDLSSKTNARGKE